MRRVVTVSERYLLRTVERQCKDWFVAHFDPTPIYEGTPVAQCSKQFRASTLEFSNVIQLDHHHMPSRCVNSSHAIFRRVQRRHAVDPSVPIVTVERREAECFRKHMVQRLPVTNCAAVNSDQSVFHQHAPCQFGDTSCFVTSDETLFERLARLRSGHRLRPACCRTRSWRGRWRSD